MSQKWRGTAVCGAVTAFLGFLCLVVMPVRDWFERLSFDLPCLFASSASLGDVVIVTRDEKSYRDLNQEYGKLWNRRLYARLLDRLTSDKARLAVFDIFLSDPGSAAENTELAQAIRRNGHVVLAMDYREYPQLKGGEPIYPQNEFKEAAAGLGVSSCLPDEADHVVRRMHPGYEKHPSLAWTAAELAGAPATVLQTRMRTERWLNYPSSLEQLRRISFSDALQQQLGFFSNKVVFVGGSPRTKLEGDQADEFATPFRRWHGAPQPGVIIQAVAFLNLIRGTWLERFTPMVELLLVMLLGGLSATMLVPVRPWLGANVAAALIVVLYASACVLMFQAHRWFPWMIMAGAQIPFSFAWSLLEHSKRRIAETQPIPSQPAVQGPASAGLPPTLSEAPTVPSDSVANQTKPSTAPAPVGAEVVALEPFAQGSARHQGPKWIPPSVPDHTLVRCIGEGGYGQVWLARDVIGTYHAVKLVYRKTFNSAIPFDREFTGIQHFTPISRMHPGFVHILHVGRNEAAGYFFYIMELGDDENAGQKIDPETYTAKTLHRVIRKHGRLPATDCVKLGLELSAALEFLHSNRLIHRDIKPSNVLYVHGHAKFADVGLVTEIRTQRGDATYIGTEGYIAPEGPGTTGADVYALGKLLYEIAMGLDRKRFPDLPTSAVDEISPILQQLNRIILKACEPNPRERYQSAGALHDDLQALLPR